MVRLCFLCSLSKEFLKLWNFDEVQQILYLPEKKAKETAEYVKWNVFRLKMWGVVPQMNITNEIKRISTGFWKTVAASQPTNLCSVNYPLLFPSRAYRRCRIIVREISTNCLVTNALWRPCLTRWSDFFTHCFAHLYSSR